jgi:hypothetical protein
MHEALQDLGDAVQGWVLGPGAFRQEIRDWLRTEGDRPLEAAIPRPLPVQRAAGSL